ncbi:LPS translocon maturation chaperone LptM [Salinarimonas soli]|uniref:Lipoprotein n=1 Tax=Salinarimonas soli TaxID=1638099 RepID=A0A5B2VBC2_9HYPH|nr:lipoprotein [Salinarimonas soli]KAA2236361.1 hypothetical protein F0L46_14560 [Salinarimonas soli]
MTLPLSPAGRALMVAGALLVALSACGRRGPLEPPPVAAVPAAAPGTVAAQTQAEVAEEGPDTILPSVSPTPPASSRQQKRGFTIPKDPFILDPLL